MPKLVIGIKDRNSYRTFKLQPTYLISFNKKTLLKLGNIFFGKLPFQNLTVW